MSQENVDTVRRGFEAFNEGNPRVFLDLYDADIVLRVAPDVAAEPGTLLGAARVERWFQEFFATFGRSARIDVFELIEAGDSVISVHTGTARGRLSGARVEGLHHAVIFTFRGGKIIRIDVGASRDEALEALGLRG